MDGPSSLSFVAFTLDEQHYALPVCVVERVVRAAAITALPRAPNIVLGVIKVGARVIPVLDLRDRFRLPTREIAPGDCFILARTSQHVVAITADRVNPVQTYAADAISTADTILPNLPYLKGVAKLREDLLLIQDLDRFLSLEEETQLSDAMGALALG